MGDYRVKVHTKDVRGCVFPMTVVVDADDKEDVHTWLRRAVRSRLILIWTPIADQPRLRQELELCCECQADDLEQWTEDNMIHVLCRSCDAKWTNPVVEEVPDGKD